MNTVELQSLATVLALVSFLGVSYWAYSSKQKSRFDEDAFLPFDDDEITNIENTLKEKKNNE